jgi:hypothetical protein
MIAHASTQHTACPRLRQSKKGRPFSWTGLPARGGIARTLRRQPWPWLQGGGARLITGPLSFTLSTASAIVI